MDKEAYLREGYKIMIKIAYRKKTMLPLAHLLPKTQANPCFLSQYPLSIFQSKRLIIPDMTTFKKLSYLSVQI